MIKIKRQFSKLFAMKWTTRCSKSNWKGRKIRSLILLQVQGWRGIRLDFLECKNGFVLDYTTVLPPDFYPSQCFSEAEWLRIIGNLTESFDHRQQKMKRKEGGEQEKPQNMNSSLLELDFLSSEEGGEQFSSSLSLLHHTMTSTGDAGKTSLWDTFDDEVNERDRSIQWWQKTRNSGYFAKKKFLDRKRVVGVSVKQRQIKWHNLSFCVIFFGLLSYPGVELIEQLPIFFLPLMHLLLVGFVDLIYKESCKDNPRSCKLQYDILVDDEDIPCTIIKVLRSCCLVQQTNRNTWVLMTVDASFS